MRQDLDTLMLPLMKMLYNAPSRTPNQVYMLLIIVLILSQDASFNANIHKLNIRDVPWYKAGLHRAGLHTRPTDRTTDGTIDRTVD